MTFRKNDNVLIAQITDSHIVPAGEHWQGDLKAKTDIRLKSVIESINCLQIPPDLVIHTGDIVDNGSIESYVHAKKLLDKLNVKYFLTCGNHDNFNNLKYVFTDHTYWGTNRFANYVIDCLPIRIIVLDTQVQGEEYGKLCRNRIKWLTDIVNSSTKETIIFLHHFPIEVNNILFKNLNLLESSTLSKLIIEHKNILGLYCGHYHYAMQQTFASRTCWISPSTAPSHILRSNNSVGLNYTPPAYSLHYFDKNFREIKSKVIKLNDVENG